MQRLTAHLLAAVVRLAFTAAMCLSLPYSHMSWGESPESGGVEGQAAFGLLLILAVIALLAGFSYLTIGCVAHVLLRRRLPYVMALDIALGFALSGFLITGGVNATYNSATQSPLNGTKPAAK
jgi:hypothetical protein